jgi:hypothetical protein
VASVERQAAFDKASHGLGLLVSVQLAVGQARVIIDQRVHPLIADPHPYLCAGFVAIAGDGVTGPGEPREALGIDVQQITRARPLISPWLVAGLTRRS